MVLSHSSQVMSHGDFAQDKASSHPKPAPVLLCVVLQTRGPLQRWLSSPPTLQARQ